MADDEIQNEGGLRVAGVQVSEIISDDGAEMVVLLEDGRKATIPSSSPIFSAIQEDTEPRPPAEIPPPSIGDVRAEERRRIRDIMLAQDADELQTKTIAILMEIVELLSVRLFTGKLSADQLARMAALRTIINNAAMIRAASRALEVLDPIPADYQDDRHWS